ncbi:transcription elongation factor GreA [Ezakiella coagulans]|uniref:Transcription elongation factor GreA n=1 Tax=Ezakiella coagulans TaxID=46507 RepID=A0A2U1E5Z2_9FIRM|nr:transcription elongation factor GreA [Ezakiella coagulans]KGF08483.1 transcription elongation factor GreA [Tissierellia bacterium S7-1-4]PVY95366.1 transcription elongation factor GreA [Ezakiella coagulans]UQK60337.1 transcription elongation factor GreA [Ezakiella coagulans]
MAEKEVFLTREGYDNLKNELEELKTVTRKEVSERIKVALGYGDLSENAEYDQAKNEQALVEDRILQIENILRMAKIVEEHEVTTDKVNISTDVTVLEEGEDEPEVFSIVGSAESDPINNKISNESPLGAALLGRRRKDVVEVEAPDGVIRYKIISIKKTPKEEKK